MKLLGYLAGLVTTGLLASCVFMCYTSVKLYAGGASVEVMRHSANVASGLAVLSVIFGIGTFIIILVVEG